jgi:hypothetical protein
MLRWILLAVVVVALTATATFLVQYAPDSDSRFSSAANVPRGPQPKVEIVQPLIYDFGTMAQESNGTYSWEIKNSGEGRLDLWLEGKTTCSCTVAKLQKAKEGEEIQRPVVAVEPGASTKIDLEWNTKKLGVEYSQGATIGTNDPSRPTFKITVKGRVYPPVSVFPPDMITLNGISNEETTKARVAVYSMDRPETKIKKLSTSRPALITATHHPMLESDRVQLKVKSGGYRVDLEVKPGMPMGPFSDELVIETDHPLRPVVKVAIAGRTTGPISIVPPQLRMSNVTAAQGASQDLTVLVRGARPTKFQVAHKPSQVDVNIAPNDTASQKGRYRLTVTVPPGTPAAHIEEVIVLKTDHPKAGEVKIPVMILISNSDAG